jgi:Na+/proline symporter
MISMLQSVVIATLVPILIYVVVGLSKRSKVLDVQEFFIYGQKVSMHDYANTSVGYALQMAAVFLFAYWAMIYGVGALWTAVFWFLGYLLLHSLLPRFLPYHKNPITLHEYIATTFNGGRKLQLLASAATMLGLWGTMMAEVDYTSQVYAPIVSAPWGAYTLQVLFLLFGTVYIIFNGFKAEVRTERIQVPVAYLGLILTLALALPSVWRHAGERSYYIVLAIFICTLLLILLGKLQLGLHKALKDPQTWIPVFGVLVLGVVHCFVTLTTNSGAAASILDKPLSVQMKAQGWFPLLSLFLANVLWMPVDLSTWQRIASVEGSGTELLISLRKGTRRVLFESPASWCLGIVLGLIIDGGGFLGPRADASLGIGAFASALVSGAALSPLVYLLFIAACVAVMLSTVDSIVAAIAYTASRDISQTYSLSRVRLWTLGIVVAGLVVYPVLRITLGASLAVFLYAAYSAQLALVTVVALVLIRRRLDPRAAFVSVLTGIFAAVVCAILVSGLKGAPDASVLSPVFAVIGSVLGYLLVYRRTVSDQNELSPSAPVS